MNNIQKYPMTPLGAQTLTDELNHLKSEVRPQIIEAIATARAHGDLKENAEYHAAREQQSFTEGRIQELEARLSHVQIIDVTAMQNNGKIVFGATVTLLHMQDDTETTYQIVGEEEADIKQNKISYTSPIGRALVGKSLDDSVEVNTPDGMVEYEVTAVEYI